MDKLQEVVLILKEYNQEHIIKYIKEGFLGLLIKYKGKIKKK